MELEKLLTSKGSKRNAAAVLSAVTGVLAAVPEATPVIGGIQSVAGVLGITGLAHATGAKTLSKAKLAAITSFIAFLIALAPLIPALEPYVPVLQQLAAILGAATTGAIVATKSKRKNES